jgi:sugar lactone lactonase YvrE
VVRLWVGVGGLLAWQKLEGRAVALPCSTTSCTDQPPCVPSVLMPRYANGVALAPDESFVAVVETCSMRVRRRWLKGPKVGCAWEWGAWEQGARRFCATRA